MSNTESMAKKISPQRKPHTGIQEGAAALQLLISDIGEVSEATWSRFDDDGKVDGRDYVAMTVIVERSINCNVVHAAPAQREGYLRALADLLCLIGEGFSPGKDWNPIVTTALAFDAAKGALEVNHGY